MVLNLLYTRSLEEARAFLDRSFSRYLGGIGLQVGGRAGGCCPRQHSERAQGAGTCSMQRLRRAAVGGRCGRACLCLWLPPV